MTEKEWELVRRFKMLVEEKLHVNKMVVFGSRARGDAQAESDLDILVVIDEPETYTWLRFISTCAWEACFGTGILLSPVVYSRDRWENEPSLLAPAIEREGVAV